MRRLPCAARPGARRAGARPARVGRALIAVALGAGSIAACRPAPSSDGATEAPATRVRDSAGVRLVAAGFAAADSGPLLRVTDTLLDGARARDEAVVGLVSLLPLGDSAFAFFSASGPALWVVDRDGAAPRALAGDPSRAVAPASADSAPPVAGVRLGARSLLLPYTADTLLLWDAEAGRLARVTADGLRDALPLDYPPERLSTVSGAFTDGTVIGVTIVPPGEQALGYTRAPAALLRFTTDGRLRDTLAEFRGPERVVQAGPIGGEPDRRPMRAVSVPFGRGTLWSVGGASVLLFDTERCGIERRDGDGRLLQRLDLACAIEAVTERDRRQFLTEVLATARSAADSTIRRRFVEQATFPPTKATGSGLITDAWDRIWVRRPVSSADEPWRWQVFAADGTPLATFRLGRDWRIAAVRPTDLLLVASERDDAPPVVGRVRLPDALVTAP